MYIKNISNFIFIVLYVQNNLKKTKGIITDGQIRRISEKKGNLDNLKVKNVMTKNPISIDKNILTNAIQKVVKNFGAFIKVDNNQEYIFHPEISTALEKVEKNNIFNSLFLLFCSIG